MDISIEIAGREKIALFLPAAIGKALGSYKKFSAKPDPDDAKAFAEHHKACRVAVTHIELLLKLARLTDMPGGETETENFSSIIAEAEEKLAEYRRINGAEDGEVE